ncbi:MAG: hypothetical protein PWP62_2304 [Eubacteriaceae bacterium]|nr:hypothetical protein [Eubacteriaceae bacterium]
MKCYPIPYFKAYKGRCENFAPTLIDSQHVMLNLNHGAPERIRTSGTQFRKLLLYPPELRAHNVFIITNFFRL